MKDVTVSDCRGLSVETEGQGPDKNTTRKMDPTEKQEETDSMRSRPFRGVN